MQTGRCYLCSQTTPVEFWVVDFDLPVLIGMSDLAKFEFVIDPRSRQLISRRGGEITVAEFTEVEKARNKLANTVSGFNSSEEANKFAEAREIFGRLAGHLTTERREFLWNMFMEYREAWIDPNIGMVKDIEAEFQVKGTPVKTPLRPMSQELTDEMSKQIREMLDAKVIRPSKSPWGAAPL